MAIRKIVLMGNPILREVAAPVDDVRADDIARLAEDMKETLLDIDARGIAAPRCPLVSAWWFTACRLTTFPRVQRLNRYPGQRWSTR